MLVQSRIRYEGESFTVLLDILPALPECWSKGRMKGVRVKGNLEIDFDWQDRLLKSLVIRNKGKSPVPVLLRSGAEERELLIKPGETKII
jgi:alpha-L-fucosidase 2